MTKLNFAKKMILSILSFTVPICLLSALMFQVQTKDIEFARQEMRGADYQRPLIKVLKLFTLHGFMAQRFLSGESKYKGNLEELSRDIDKTLQDLQAKDRELGVALEFTEDGLQKRDRRDANVQFLERSWSQIKSKIGSMTSAESDSMHARVVTEIMKMNSHLGDTSNLILDPDLDSYYIMDVILLGLPQAQERLNSLLSLAGTLSGKANLTSEDRVRLAVFASLIRESDLERIDKSIRTSLSEDSHFYGISESLHKNLLPALEAYRTTGEKLLKLLNKTAIADKSDEDFNDLLISARQTLEEGQRLFDSASEEMDVLLEKRLDSLSGKRILNLSLSILVLVLSCSFAAWIAYTMNKALTELNKSLMESEEKIRISSEQMNHAGIRLSESSTEAAASLEETVASLEELSSMVKRTSDNSQEAARISGSANTQATKGEEEMRSLIQAMGGISEASKKVEEITSVIDDIAFQTNLLALNAAVEAARAGEQGKGFAVVAEAVRTLAQRSAASAKDISILIKDTVEKIDEGGKTADRSRSVLGEIVQSIRRVSELNNDIASSNVEQSAGIEQINKAMNQLDQVGQTNAASAEEIAGTSEALLQESKAMQVHVEKLIEMVGRTDRA